jgi:hypothetical protein
VPLLSEVKSVESIYEIKALLLSSETDDGRPILFQESKLVKGLYNVLGGKIDNVQDAIQHLSVIVEQGRRI